MVWKYSMGILAKIVIMGDGAVGKTSLRNSFMGEKFTSNYQMTIGADFALKEHPLTVDRKSYDMKFQIWDLAGQQRFQEVRSVYYQGTVGAILVFDVTRPDTFENTIKWLLELRKFSGKKSSSPPVVILGNKVDLRGVVDMTLTKKDGETLAEVIPKYYCDDKFKIPYLEVSAKTGENVDKAFGILGEHIIRKSIISKSN